MEVKASGCHSGPVSADPSSASSACDTTNADLAAPASAAVPAASSIRRWSPLHWLAPVPPDRRPRRAIQLIGGLLLYGITMGLMVRAALGLDPWDVFHWGLMSIIPLSYGTVITLTSAVVLLLWIPLRQRPGVGTIANALIIGWTTDATMAVLPPVHGIGWRITLLVIAVAGNALAGALYIGAGLGPGPRDGLMTGLVARGVGSIRVVRTGIELTVLAIGWLLGGTVGVATVVYALAIGPLLHILLPRLRVDRLADPADQGPAVEAEITEEEQFEGH
jgi:uncharacterized membrane protein YczE